MNVFFHVATAVGIAVSFTDTNKIKRGKDTVIPACCAFISGIFIHRILDYIPHTYPFSAKTDVIISLFLIAVMLALANRKCIIILIFAILGCTLPDLIDLLPSIVNKYMNLNIPVTEKIFPWHSPLYSGSIFTGTSTASDINHIGILLIIAMICWCRKTDFINIFNRKNKV